MCYVKAWKVYGLEGHRQRESFHSSCCYDWSDDKGIRILEVLNSDITGTNVYSIIRITRDTPSQCEEEFVIPEDCYIHVDVGFFDEPQYIEVLKEPEIADDLSL